MYLRRETPSRFVQVVCVMYTHCKNLDSIKSDCSLTGKLQKKHEHQDDQKWMEHGFLEDISESELGVRRHVLQNLRVQGDQGVEVILVQGQQVLGGHGYKTNI